MMKLQVLLREQWRNPDGVESVKKILASLGLRATISGLATISAEVEQSQFESLFGGETADPRDEKQFPAALRIPGPLTPYVESITVAPRHSYFR
jgi:hypothetical protein